MRNITYYTRTIQKTLHYTIREIGEANKNSTKFEGTAE